jgi:hypothetical protein
VALEVEMDTGIAKPDCQALKVGPKNCQAFAKPKKKTYGGKSVSL